MPNDPRDNDRPHFHTDLRVLIRWHVHLCTAEVEEAAFDSLLTVLESSGDGPDRWFKAEYETLMEEYAGADGKPRRQMLEGEWADVDEATAGRGKYVPFRKEVFRRLDEHDAVKERREVLKAVRGQAEAMLAEAERDDREVDWESDDAQEVAAPCRDIVADHLRDRYCKDLDAEAALGEADDFIAGPLPLFINEGGDDLWRQAERLLFVRAFSSASAAFQNKLLFELRPYRRGIPDSQLEGEAMNLMLKWINKQLTGDRFVWYECGKSSLAGWSCSQAKTFVKDHFLKGNRPVDLPMVDSADGPAAPAGGDGPAEAAEWLTYALAALPLRQREAMYAGVLSGAIRGETEQYMADVLGREPDDVAKDRAKAMKELIRLVKNGEIDAPFSESYTGRVRGNR